jgi:hypothetical protein
LVVAADGRVNEHPDFRTVDAGRLEQLFHRVDALVAGKPLPPRRPPLSIPPA